MQNNQACTTMNLDIQFDNFPRQTSWEILDSDNNIVVSSSTYSRLVANANITEGFCLEDGCYTLNFRDALNNGMCQNIPYIGNIINTTATGVTTTSTINTTNTPGSIIGTIGVSVSPQLCGSYKLLDSDGAVIATGGGDFGGQQSTTFCVSSGSVNRLDNTSDLNNNEIEPLNIYPTIASDFINLDFNLNSETNINLAIYDINGKLVDQYINYEVYANEDMQLDISNLNRGHYLIKMNSYKVAITKRFVKE